MSKKLSVVLLISVGAVCGQLQAAPAESELLFVRRIQPLFKDHCLKCHGDDQADVKGEFDLRNEEMMMIGGESGMTPIVPGKPEESPLYLATARTHKEDWEPMPPKEGKKLSPVQLGYIRDWIRAGALWPSEEAAEAIQKEYQEAWSQDDKKAGDKKS